MTSDEKHEVSRQIIHSRWHHHNWMLIANEVSFTQSALRELRLSSEYKDQVWADYGRAPHCFNRHHLYEDAVTRIRIFFGIPKRVAVEVLGNDWKEPLSPDPIQLQLNL